MLNHRVAVQCQLSLRKKILSPMCLLATRNKEPPSPTLQSFQGIQRSMRRGTLCPTTCYLRCNFPNLNVPNPRFGSTSATTTSVYSIPKHLWVTAASMHLEGNAAKWFEAYRLSHPTITWKTLCADIQAQFGSDDYRSAITELIALRHTSTVEEYITQF